MIKEEKKILERCGKKNPFVVPDGYFENFAENLMEQLPENHSQEPPEIGMWQRIKPWLYMAAMFCGLMLSVRFFVGSPDRDAPVSFSETVESSEFPDEYIDPIVKQAMMDDYTLYQYLTNADSEIYK